MSLFEKENLFQCQAGEKKPPKLYGKNYLSNKSAEQNGTWKEVKMNPRFKCFFITTINRLRSCQTMYSNN